MPLDDLVTTNDATYADDAGDASVKLHQQYHDLIHEYLRKVGDVVNKTASYTFVLTDAGKTLKYNSATDGTFTIPNQATVAFLRGNAIRVVQVGTGRLTLAHVDGSTKLVSRGSVFRTAGQYAVAEVFLVDASPELWVASGDLVA